MSKAEEFYKEWIRSTETVIAIGGRQTGRTLKSYCDFAEAYHKSIVESEKKKSLLGRNNDLVEYSEGYKLGFMKGRAFEKELLKQKR